MVAVERNVERNDRIREAARRNPHRTYAELANDLGLTRGVVVGVLDRLHGRVAASRRPVAKAALVAPKAPQKPATPPAAPAARPQRPDTQHPEGMLRVNLVSLQSRHCRAPLEHGANKLMTYCGLEKVPLSSYCQHHRLRYGGGNLAG